jgi:site-specific recombinase XerD
MAPLEPPELAACRWWARGGKTRAIPIEGGLEQVLETYLAARRARFEHHDLDYPATFLFVDVLGRGLSVDQVEWHFRAARRSVERGEHLSFP